MELPRLATDSVGRPTAAIKAAALAGALISRRWRSIHVPLSTRVVVTTRLGALSMVARSCERAAAAPGRPYRPATKIAAAGFKPTQEPRRRC
jgi:hypothetical protein